MLPDNNLVITKLQGIFHVANRDELCHQLGTGEIMLGDYLPPILRRSLAAAKPGRTKAILQKIWPIGRRKDESPAGSQPQQQPINPKKTYALRVDADGANFRLSDCCSPIPGDDVMGFVNDDGELEIHTLDCPRAQLLKATYGSRIVATEWESVDERFLAHIRIEGIDRRGILQELTMMISTHLGIDMRKVDIEASGAVFHCDLWVRVCDADVVRDLCSHRQ